MAILPKCWQDKQDCFALLGSQCSLLRDGYKKGKKCPFYKPKSDVSEPEIRESIRLYKKEHVEADENDAEG